MLLRSLASLATVGAVLLACAPSPPPGIPSSASVHSGGLKGGPFWTWTSHLEHGCAVWMANDSWANVQLLLESQCEGDRARGYLPGRGVIYANYEDFLVFRGYWPWSDADHDDRMVSNAKGMISDVLPCGHSIAVQEAGEIRMLAREALAAAQTDRERRMLARVVQRLDKLKGSTLASGGSGCTDYDVADARIDVW
jgi:hypothetical protein